MMWNPSARRPLASNRSGKLKSMALSIFGGRATLLMLQLLVGGPSSLGRAGPFLFHTGRFPGTPGKPVQPVQPARGVHTPISLMPVLYVFPVFSGGFGTRAGW